MACSVEGLGTLPKCPTPLRHSGYQDVVYGIRYQDVSGYHVYYEEVRRYGIRYHDVGGYGLCYDEVGRYGIQYQEVRCYGIRYQEVRCYGIRYDGVRGYGVYDQVDRYPSGLIGHREITSFPFLGSAPQKAPK